MSDQPVIDAGSTSGRESGLIAWAHVIYGLHALSVLTGILTSVTIVSAFVFGWPSIIAVILNYVKRGEAEGTFIATHFRWQIRTFWFALAWSVLSGVLFITLVGIPFALILIFCVSIWVAYRVIRGWLALSNGKPMQFAD